MASLDQLFNLVKQLNEKYNLLVTNAKKAEELPIMEEVNPESLIIVSEQEAGVWVSKQLELQKIIAELSTASQNNEVREILLGTITEDHDLAYLLDNNGITVSPIEIVVLTALVTIENQLIQRQFLWKSGKGEYNPIGSSDINDKLLELQPKFLNEITADELTSSPSAIVYDFGIITDPIIDVLNTADPARDYTDDEKIYYIRATKDGVNLLYNFVGTNGTYGDGELQMTESDLVLVYSSLNIDITTLLNSKLDKGAYAGDAGQLDNRLTVLENYTPPPTTGATGAVNVVWAGMGYTYDIVYSSYYINGVLYPAGVDRVTLSDAHATDDRIDVFALDATGGIVLQGTPSSDPQAEETDNTQIYITFQIVNASTTEPVNANQNIVYNEGTETEVISVGSVLSFNNTVGPLDGTYCLNVDYTTTAGIYYFDFIFAENKKIIEADGFKFFVRFLRNVTSGRGFRIQFFKGTTAVSDKINFIRANASGSSFESIYGIKYNDITNYQLIYIPYSDFNFSSSDFNKIKIEFTVGVELKMDYLALVASGVSSSVSPDKKAIKTIVTDDGLVAATTAEDTIQMRGINGTRVRALGKIIEIDSSAVTTMWHKFPWADTGGITIVGDVVTATNAVFEAEMVGASILVGESRYIINNYNSETEVTLQSGVLGTTTAPNGSWGIYNKAIEITTTGYLNLYGTSSPVPASVYSEGTMMLPDYVLTIGSLIGIFSDSMQFTQNVPLVWRSGTMGEDGSKDVGLRRNAEGKFEIFDGITAGQFRDLVVRHVSGVTATDPAHYVPLAQMEAADTATLTAANAYTDEGLALKLNAADYNDRFKGKFLTEAAMRAAYPTANVGDEAQVNEVGSETVKNFSWDDELNDWVQSGSGGSGATNTDALPEGSTNLYFTTARVLATVLTGLSAASGTFTSSDSLLTALGKIKYLIDNIASTYQTIAPNVQSISSSATVTPVSTNDEVIITAQAVNLTLANPTGTFAEGQALLIRIKDNGTSRTITFGSNYRAVGVTLPTATTISKTLYFAIIYNNTDSKWDIVGYRLEA